MTLLRGPRIRLRMDPVNRSSWILVRRINPATTCPSDIRFPSIVSSLPLLSRIFVLIPLHLVPMVSKASYNGCDQRRHRESLKETFVYILYALCNRFWNFISNVTSNEMYVNVARYLLYNVSIFSKKLIYSTNSHRK